MKVSAAPPSPPKISVSRVSEDTVGDSTDGLYGLPATAPVKHKRGLAVRGGLVVAGELERQSELDGARARGQEGAAVLCLGVDADGLITAVAAVSPVKVV